MQYPANARRIKIEGTIHVSFIVSKTGEISDVSIMRGIMTECDREAVRVVTMMPPWNPGKQNGRNVNVRFLLPLKFRL
jgi:protein TonB